MEDFIALEVLIFNATRMKFGQAYLRKANAIMPLA